LWTLSVASVVMRLWWRSAAPMEADLKGEAEWDPR
jgi:hypothetical protein